MTITCPRKNILDWILRLFGKERQIYPPKNYGRILDKFGPYTYVLGEREGFWSALFRRKSCFRSQGQSGGRYDSKY